MHKKEPVEASSQFQVYNASAGSGKTFTLVKEYLKIVLSTDNVFRFQHILAITFTNKAAAEMKERVLKNLQDFSEGNNNVMFTTLVDETGLEDEVLQQRSKRVLDSVLQNYSAFNITTIDSFTHRIIRSFAFDLGLSLNFDVEMDAGLLLDEAVDVLISKIGDDKHLTQVLIDYSLDKTDDDKSWDISRDLKEFSRILLNENHVNHLKLLEGKTVEDYTKLKKHLKKEINKTENKFIEIGKQGLDLINRNNIEHNNFSNSDLPNFFKKLINIKYLKFDSLKFEGRLYNSIQSEVFYSKSNKKISQDTKDVIDEYKFRFIDLYNLAKNIYDENYSRYILNDLVLKSLIPLAVLKHINTSLTEIKEQNNIRLNAEFNQLISDKIKDEPAPFIYERIGEKFRYYFIDEMQDTSELQWQNLIPLIENSLTSETVDGQKGSLMLVGDAKQAIYRWRGGKAEQFIDLSQQSQSLPFSIKKEVKNLETNHRSYSQIIDFNNQFFTHVSGFLGNEKYKELYVTGNHQEKTEKKGGFVQLSFLDIDKDDLEKEFAYPKEVLKIIQNLDPEFKRNDVCVLVRTKKQGIAVSDYLTENKVPIVSSETLLLKNNESVDFVINILLSIHNPVNKEAIANFLYLLSEKLGLGNKIHQFLIERIDLTSDELFKTLHVFGFNFSLKEFISLPFYESIEYILRSFNLLNGPNAFIQAFLDFVLEYEQKRGLGLNDFLEHWERKKESLSIAIPDGQDAIKIMTIHKSKGLEFPVVIFPYDLNIYKETNPKIWYDDLNSEEFLGFETALIDYSKKVGYISEYGEQLFLDRKEEIQLDNLNLLYVALTRAEEQLYVVTKKQPKEKELSDVTTYSDLFIDFLRSRNDEQQWSDEQSIFNFGNPDKVSKQHSGFKEEFVIRQEKFISSSWKNQNISIVANSSTLWGTEQGEAIAYGNLIHEILSKIKTKNDIDEIIEQYKLEGMLNKDNAAAIKDVIILIVEHPLLKTYYIGTQIVLNEQEIVTTDNRIQIPDRIQIIDDKVIIIDYKTGVSKQHHHTQLVNYAKVLEEMNFKVDKKLLVYINAKVNVIEVG